MASTPQNRAASTPQNRDSSTPQNREASTPQNVVAGTPQKKSNTKRNKSTDVTSKYQAAIDAVVEMAKPRDTEEDMYTLFAKSLALQLKQMPKRNACQVMSEVQQLVSAHLLRCMDSGTEQRDPNSMPVHPNHQQHTFFSPRVKESFVVLPSSSHTNVPYVLEEQFKVTDNPGGTENSFVVLPSSSQHTNVPYVLEEQIEETQNPQSSNDLIRIAIQDAGIFFNEDEVL